MNFVINDGTTIDIAEGDWICTINDVIPFDPDWGWSYEVVGFHSEKSIIVLARQGVLYPYEETILDACFIIENWRQVLPAEE